MSRNKPRIQIALYARPKYPGTYHYALYIAPKTNKGSITKHHVKNTLLVGTAGDLIQPWRYEKLELSDINMEMALLLRVTVAKVTKDRSYVEQLLETVPIYQVDDSDQMKAQAFSCRTWIIEAYRRLQAEGAVAAGCIEWEVLDRQAREWIDVQREQGRWRSTWTGSSAVPTLNLLTGKDIGT